MATSASVKSDLKFAAIAAAIAGLPLFFVFGALWNPHGSIGSVWLHYVGEIGIAPLLYVSDLLAPRLGMAGFVIACVAQYVWFALGMLLLRHLLRTLYALL